MATIFNKRQHNLVIGAVAFTPGENTVPDDVWAELNVPGSQVEAWSRLNWLSVKRSLPQAKQLGSESVTVTGGDLHVTTGKAERDVTPSEGTTYDGPHGGGITGGGAGGLGGAGSDPQAAARQRRR